MRYAIYGAGALGTVLGAYIARAGVEIDLFNRNRAHVEALRKNGAKIIGTAEFTQKVNAFYPEEMQGEYDVILLMTKQQNNPEVVAFLKDHLKADGALCTCQNGLPEPAIAEIVGADRTLGCAIAWGATFHGEGVSELTSEPSALTFSLGAYGGGEVASRKNSRRVAQRIIKECIDVSRALGVTVEPVQGHDIVKLFDYKGAFKKKISFMLIPVAMKKHKNLVASMLQDIRSGKPCEIAFINGAVSAQGRKANVPTPFNDRTVEIVSAIERGEKTFSFDNIALYNDLF